MSSDDQVRYILNDLLTYIQFYFRSSHENVKKVVCRFYTPGDIADAESVRTKNTNEIQSKMVRRPSRQRSVTRDVYEADVQDTLNIFTMIDSSETFCIKFVHRNIKNVPKYGPGETDSESVIMTKGFSQWEIEP